MEKRLDILEHAVEHERITARLNTLDMKVDDALEANSRLEKSMAEGTLAMRDLTTQVSQLVDVVKPIAEDWKTRSYGLKWFRSMADNSKLLLAIGIGVLAYSKLDVILPLVVKAFSN
jgi:hypothetical protein